MTTIAVLPGDGIGAEIIDGPLAYLRHLQDTGVGLQLTGPWPYGTTGWVETGSVLPAETVEACRNADVVLSGAVGSHPSVTADECPNPESALISLRHLFDLRISVRVVRVPAQRDVFVVRNITGGAYSSADTRRESDGVTSAEDRIVLEPERVREVLEFAVQYARASAGRVISVDKASVFATSRLWRRTARAVADETGTFFESINVDRAAYELASGAHLPAVIVTEGIFGDILSDIVCARAGSPAVCGSATVNSSRAIGGGITGLFEPAHGTSPHRTGTRTSNPTGAWLCLAQLCAWCPDLAALGLDSKIRGALDEVIATSFPTYDLVSDGGRVTDMDEFNDKMLTLLSEDRGAFVPRAGAHLEPSPASFGVG